MVKENLIGRRFGMLRVIGEADNIGKKTAWLCECKCGTVKPITTNKLKAGTTVSCGCQRSIRHGHCNTRLYTIWADMKQRCGNPNNTAFKNYGARGITVCPEWAEDFGKFYDWAMSHGYQDDLTIDRIENDVGYSPDNCRWVTQACNLTNTRRNVTVEVNGETHTVAEWSRITGANERTIRNRLKAGKSPEEAIVNKHRMGGP